MASAGAGSNGPYAVPDAVGHPHRALRFRVLGPLEVVRGGQPCTPSAPKQRALLALLLLHANELLPAATIIDRLWNDRPPRSAAAALQVYVSAVRRALLPAAGTAAGDPRRHPVLRTHRSGYVLHLEPGQLDLAQFRLLAARGRAELAEGRCAQAGETFRRALGLWRGAALCDLDGSGGRAHYAVRLEEERLGLLQERIAVDLCQRRGPAAVGEVEELVARYPLRERLHQQLMIALYLDGRRAEALDAYRRAYRIMTEEAGIEPGPGLRAAQQAILGGWEPVDRAHGCRRRPP